GKAKVAWDVVCLLKDEGGLGIRRLAHFNSALMCSFADAVWSHMKTLAGLDRVSHDVYDVIVHFGMNAKRKSTHVVIAKMVLAAFTYFIWQECNWRLFKKYKRSVNQVIECITSAFRLKLLSCRFKRSKEGVSYAQVWELPESILDDSWSFLSLYH
nr:hypothetical protein [Tanacetum cinerariifolium]